MPEITQNVDVIPTNTQVLGQTDNHIIWLSEHIGVHQQMLPAFKAMQVAAKKEGHNLQIISGFRSFDRQLAIWQRKQSGQLAIKDMLNAVVDISQCTAQEKIIATLLFSALPGASRHHWGTDIDVYDPSALQANEQCQLEPWEYQDNGPFHRLFLWLSAHAKTFGFFFPYHKYQGGVAAEPWHLSFTPLAKTYQNKLTIHLLNQALITTDITHKTEIIANLEFIFKRFISNICQQEN